MADESEVLKYLEDALSAHRDFLIDCAADLMRRAAEASGLSERGAKPSLSKL